MTRWRVGIDAKPTNGILPDKPTIARQKEYQHYSTGQPNTEFDFRRCFKSRITGQSLAGDAKLRLMADVHWKGGKDMKNVLRLSAVLVCLMALMVAAELAVARLANLPDYGTMVEKAHLVAIATLWSGRN